MATRFPDEDLERKYNVTTVLATGLMPNPLVAVQKALAIYQLNQIQQLLRNTSFRIIWFLQKGVMGPYQTFVIFKRPAPFELKYTYL